MLNKYQKDNKDWKKINICANCWKYGQEFCNSLFLFFSWWIQINFKWEGKDTLHKEKLSLSEIEYHLTSKAAVQITVVLLPGLWNMNADLVSLPCTDTGVYWRPITLSFTFNSSPNFITNYHSVSLKLFEWINRPLKTTFSSCRRIILNIIQKLYA